MSLRIEVVAARDLIIGQRVVVNLDDVPGSTTHVSLPMIVAGVVIEDRTAHVLLHDPASGTDNIGAYPYDEPRFSRVEGL